jgi:anti-sigma regulatory factor (Ser/Thr protein kinase)
MAEPSKEPEMQILMLSQPRWLAAVRALVGTVAQRLGFSDMQCGQISLAVDEALCNVICHGYQRREDGKLWINIWSLNDKTGGLKIVIEDLAAQVDPAQIKPRSLDEIRPGGLGVHIIREVMDEVRYERRTGPGMRLTLIKHLHPSGRARSPSGRPNQQRVEP